MMSEYHVPVMLEECMEGLALRDGGTYVDATFGGGGHSREILNRISGGRLIGFDQDEEALKNVPDDKRFNLANHNFRHLYRFLKYYDAIPVDGILADLGISSHHIDNPDRGFAHRWNTPLDMRMNRQATLSALDVLNEYEHEELTVIFRDFGELKQPHRLAAAIVAYRNAHGLKTSGDVKKALELFVPKGHENKFFSQVFQAVRIEVNAELNVLKELLEQSASVLKQGGRLVIMSYHSLEDRIVKNFLASGNFEGDLQKDIYGNVSRPFKAISRAITAKEAEIAANPRSRSARLRIAEKL